MRTKLVATLAVVVAAFLIVTNPVVAQAAKLITGKQIKNGTVTSVDVKNRSLLAKDFKSGQLPTGARGPAGASGTVAVKGFTGAIGDVPASAFTWVFLGPTSSVTVDGTQALIAGATANVRSAVATTTSTAICSRTSAGTLAPLGDVNTFSLRVEVSTVLRALPAFGSAILPAGTYDIGFCGKPNAALTGNDFTIGWVEVLNSAAGATLSRPTGTHRE